MTALSKWLYGIGLCCGLSGCHAAEPTKVHVFAASSLSDAMSAIADSFESAQPGVRVEISTAGSHVLRMQLENGAESDLFASASSEDVSILVDQGLFVEPAVMAGGNLVIYLSDEHRGLEFSGLGRVESWIVGSPDSPIGRYTEHFLTALGEDNPQLGETVRDKVVSRESNVRLIRAKIDLGVADAGIVYSSDVYERDEARQVSIPPGLQPGIEYVMARSASSTSERAVSFQQYILSEGQDVLKTRRFVQ